MSSFKVYMTKYVLIIDDSKDIQRLLRMLLEAKGYHIDCTSNGVEALNLLRSCKKLPDVILLDLQMPVMDGMAFLSEHQKVQELKNIPIVLMSGEQDARRTGKINNVAEVVMKPLNITSVVQAVERIVNIAHAVEHNTNLY